MLRRRLGILALLLPFALPFASGRADAASLALEELGNGTVEVPGVGDAELSGVVWLEAGRSLAVDEADKPYRRGFRSDSQGPMTGDPSNPEGRDP